MMVDSNCDGLNDFDVMAMVMWSQRLTVMVMALLKPL